MVGPAETFLSKIAFLFAEGLIPATDLYNRVKLGTLSNPTA